MLRESAQVGPDAPAGGPEALGRQGRPEGTPVCRSVPTFSRGVRLGYVFFLLYAFLYFLTPDENVLLSVKVTIKIPTCARVTKSHHRSEKQQRPYCVSPPG